MLTSQKLSLRTSELRQRLNHLSNQDELADGESAEITRLSTEFADVESRFRAAVIGESREEADRSVEFSGDGEGSEIRHLLDSAQLSNYLGVARAGGQTLSGPENDLNAALKIGSLGPNGETQIPWAMLETRAATTTTNLDGPTNQRPILQRLFARDIFDVLGVRIDTVPAGMTEFPLLNGGVTPTQKTETTAADAAVPATFQIQSLKPKRLTGQYSFTYEQQAQVRDIEQALRRDLADAVRSSMNKQALTGDFSSNPQDVDGFLTKLTAPTAPETADYGTYASTPASAVDGKHAGGENEVSALLGVETYQHAAGVFQTGSGEAGIEAIKRRSNKVLASAHIPMQDGMIQNGNLLHAGSDAMRGDSVAAMWPTLSIIRDIYSNAAEGQVNLTWISLWDFRAAFRPLAYKRVSFKLS